MKSTDIRPGMAIRMDGAVYVVTQFTHVTPGNLRAFVQVKLKRISDGTILDKRLRSGDLIEQVDLDRRQAEYLYSDNSGHVFMDSENYEQYVMPKELIGDSMLYLKPNNKVVVLFADNKASLIELPNTVELQVTETTPAIKGATATNQLKDATVETGLKTRVPPFIQIGEVIRLSTEDGSYLSRA